VSDDTDDAVDEPRARDLVRAGALPRREVLGERTAGRLAARATRRAGGESSRLGRRVTGADPDDDAPSGRRSVYAEDRLVRLDAPTTSPAPSRPPDERPGNLGEALIPPGFRDLPIARPTPTPTPKAAAPAPKVPAPPPTPSPVSPTGRFRTAPRRAPVMPAPTVPAPTPAPPTPVSPVTPTPAAAPPPVAEAAPTDPVSTPSDGRARLGRRTPPTG
jgi:hypothetical protein